MRVSHYIRTERGDQPAGRLDDKYAYLYLDSEHGWLYLTIDLADAAAYLRKVAAVATDLADQLDAAEIDQAYAQTGSAS